MIRRAGRGGRERRTEREDAERGNDADGQSH
jgi:hypothetical protein